MLLEVCVNGARSIDEHPRLSADATAIAREAADAVRAGAGAVHVHPKAPDGVDSLAPRDVARFVAAVREACPGIPVGVTTGAWSTPEVAGRLAHIRAWTTLPDFASVNWHEDGADDVAEVLLARGVAVEAGIWNQEGLTAWQGSPHRGRCLRTLVELPDLTDADEVECSARGLVDGVRSVEPRVPVLLHGEAGSTWPAVTLAARWGLDTRIGLEDCLHLPGGEPAAGNAALVSAACQLTGSATRRVIRDG